MIICWVFFFFKEIQFDEEENCGDSEISDCEEMYLLNDDDNSNETVNLCSENFSFQTVRHLSPVFENILLHTYMK